MLTLKAMSFVPLLRIAFQQNHIVSSHHNGRLKCEVYQDTIVTEKKLVVYSPREENDIISYIQ